ncbi:MAG: AraC family transcriptional regulator [Ignavibacteriales bacterium CG12_big_fil_rev_8_21_14_0_65_30_8]|nr:MAG: AraC family transcriptional regulator [Ignavibacteriales bacterium CG12_big_fil_rev_8_21_14_0_65_30_8]
MVCPRCIKVVKDELEKIGYNIKNIKLGEASFESSTKINLELIRNILEKNGFELLDNDQFKIIEKIKIFILEYIQSQSEENKMLEKLSKYLSKKMGYSYQYLSNLFSSLENQTIENYIIHQRIEKVKELIIYNQFNLSEISYRLGYSSVQHLSSQFKKVTGFTPSTFKKLKNKKRIPIDKI